MIYKTKYNLELSCEKHLISRDKKGETYQIKILIRVKRIRIQYFCLKYKQIGLSFVLDN